ncbi:restriction endonuclease subunit S [Streptomyces sp. NPDC057460]|uniref:restriction endonuclease subunit S n=1 Tax=Streptomyces sp. NPDC057460 TaxID=3346141 RepID=UPI0036CFECE4
MNTATVQLGELVSFLSGFAFKSNFFNSDGAGLPLIRIRDVRSGRSETHYSGDYDERFIVTDGDYVIGMDGEFNIACWNGGKALLNQRVCKIDRVSPRLDRDYLARFLPRALKVIEDATPFVTVKHLSTKSLKEIEIPLPSLEEQRRIAEVLAQIDVLRVKRRETMSLLDDLTQSIFLEIFGDPARNPMSWPLCTLNELARVFSDGPFGSNLKSSHYQSAGVRVVRLQNIGVGEFLDNDRAYVSRAHFESLKKHECRPGDVLVATLGDPNIRACIQPDWLDIAINKADCVQIRTNDEKAIPEYVCALLNQPSLEAKAQSLMLGQTRVRISMGRLRTLEVPIPPLNLQKTFAQQIAAVESLKATNLAHLAELDAIFASAQHRAFRGDLWDDPIM